MEFYSDYLNKWFDNSSQKSCKFCFLRQFWIFWMYYETSLGKKKRKSYH